MWCRSCFYMMIYDEDNSNIIHSENTNHNTLFGRVSLSTSVQNFHCDMKPTAQYLIRHEQKWNNREMLLEMAITVYGTGLHLYKKPLVIDILKRQVKQKFCIERGFIINVILPVRFWGILMVHVTNSGWEMKPTSGKLWTKCLCQYKKREKITAYWS